MSRLKAVTHLGQSLWFDYIRRDLLDGGLQKLIREDGLSGLTSNPAIFEKAIAGSSLYDAQLQALVRAGHRDATALTELLAIEGMGHDLPRAVWPRIIDAISALTARA